MLRRHTLPSGRFALSLALAATLLAGCGGGGGGGSSSTAPLPTSVSAQAQDGLTISLAEDRAIIAPNDVVTYTVTVANDTAAPITYDQVTGQAPDLTIKDSGGNIVWGGAFPASTQVVGLPVPVTLAPGQSASMPPTGITALSSRGDYYATANFSVTGASSPQTTSVGALEVVVQ
jgi:hypothetical protein